MKTVYIAAGESPDGSHVHRYPDGVHSLSSGILTEKPVGSLYRCDCGQWFCVAPFGYTGGFWKPVRWYHFKYQSRINAFLRSDHG